jgi:outer membrane receptor protein involved in Fe transport
MSQRFGLLRVAGLVGALSLTPSVGAQDDPFAGSDDELGEPAAPASAAPAPPPVQNPPPAEPPAAEPPVAAGGGVSLSVSADAVAGSSGASAAAKSDGETKGGAIPVAPAGPAPVVTGSHIRRPRLMYEGALIIDSPLTTRIEKRESLQTRRQLGGVALPDTTAALGLGATGTDRFELRSQPTLVLLNGRRLVSAPFSGPQGADFADLNQVPLLLIERVETTSGNTAGLYGDGAVGGTVNYIMHRDHDGIEVDVGGQATDDFNQREGDVSLALGAGSEKTGMNAMVHYFRRSPMAATDSDWIGDRADRTESLQGFPGSFKPLLNFEYPFPDPSCLLATSLGDARGFEVRIPNYGRANTLPLLPPEDSEKYRLFNDRGRGNDNGILEPYETSTYCKGDFTSMQDLVLREERMQGHTTFWHGFTDHTEGFGELGYYRDDNENRTAPSFPVIRTTPSASAIVPVVVPVDHADQPVWAPGFAAMDDPNPLARVANSQFIVGRVAGLHAGSQLQHRRVDVLRGVLGLRGDLEEAAAGSVLETWDWELAGLYSASSAISRVPDVLVDKLAAALASCPTRMLDRDVSSPTYLTEIPSTIKHRQEAGCFNPFYSSVTNNVALDPLNVSRSGVANDRGYITSDSEANMREEDGFGLQDGGYVCDPNDPNSPPCPAELDPNGDGLFELAGTPNTKQVMDAITGEHISEERRTLGTADFVLRGDIAEFADGGLAFAAGGQYRRETLRIDYDAAFNQYLYAFVFGGPDVRPVGRDIVAAHGELRLRLAKGLVELQPAARVEYFDDTGAAVSPLVGLALRPFASMANPPEALEWLLVRGHVARGHRAPSLLQMHGTYTEFHLAEFNDATHFMPHQVVGNTDLDFEKYTTVSGGLQWDWVGIHVGADAWMTWIDDVIGPDNLQTLLRDCDAQYGRNDGECTDLVMLSGTRSISHVVSPFDNLAEVETNGVDGGVSYTLDSRRRDLGDFGTFVLGVQGRFINSYLIKSPRALREFYRPGGATPGVNPDGTRNYAGLTAEYDAAGFRNVENFAPPLPQLRFAVPLRWMYDGHALGATMRYIGAYQDDSEFVIEKYGLPNLANLAVAEGEEIAAWMVFDASYGYTFGDDGWQTSLVVGVINIADEAPPEAESPLGYDVGIHDPRGRVLYARVTGKF